MIKNWKYQRLPAAGFQPQTLPMKTISNPENAVGNIGILAG
jgi:hypothetical protein